MHAGQPQLYEAAGKRKMCLEIASVVNRCYINKTELN